MCLEKRHDSPIQHLLIEELKIDAAPTTVGPIVEHSKVKFLSQSKGANRYGARQIPWIVFKHAAIMVSA